MITDKIIGSRLNIFVHDDELMHASIHGVSEIELENETQGDGYASRHIIIRTKEGQQHVITCFMEE